MYTYIYILSLKFFSMANKDSSENKGPLNCIPNGRPEDEKPEGIEIAGRPAKLAETVKISDKYICKGSFFSPNSNAVVGVVGVIIKSTSSKISLYSFIMARRTFQALL